MLYTRILRRMGFSKTTFSEAIITIDCSSEVYSTPIGLKLVGDTLLARVFRNTGLYERIVSERSSCKYCLCVTSNPLLFYRAVLQRERLRYRCFETKCIEGCDAYILVDKTSVVNARNYCLVQFKPLRIIVVNKNPRTLRRVNYAVVEALVYYTKIPYLEPRDREILVEKIKWCREVVYRSSTSRLYRELVNNILARAEALLDKPRDNHEASSL